MEGPSIYQTHSLAHLGKKIMFITETWNCSKMSQPYTWIYMTHRNLLYCQFVYFSQAAGYPQITTAHVALFFTIYLDILQSLLKTKIFQSRRVHNRVFKRLLY
jgi:hypothetical protein